jgi:hypothetical protein
MKSKIVGILVCIMLMTTFITTAQDVENIYVKNESEENEPISFNLVEAPVWEEGYSWTYKIHRFKIDFEKENLTVYMDLKMDNLFLEVIQVTEDYYELEFDGGSTGSFWIAFNFDEGPINISFELKSTTIEGTILLNKTDLKIIEFNPRIYGHLDVKIEEQPFIDFPFKLHKDIIGTIDLQIIMENLYTPIIKFPFQIGEFWGLPGTNFTLDGTIESPTLDKIDNWNLVINPILKWLYEKFGWSWLEELIEFSDILLDILPIIDISYVLEKYVGIDNVFKIPTSPPPPKICCLGKDIITVPAGTFECYDISILGTNLAHIYYNDTEVKNIVKVVGNFQEIIPSVSDVLMELISYNT